MDQLKSQVKALAVSSLLLIRKSVSSTIAKGTNWVLAKLDGLIVKLGGTPPD